MNPIGIKLTLDGQREVSQGLQQVGNDLGKLGNAGSQLGGLRQGMGSAARTAGQLQQATQQLPMQFQDIVVSLQAGQQPLTVMLQQGSQLAGSFGGAGAAAKAMAGYVVGLVNPITVAGAAVIGLGVAMASVEKTLRADTSWQAYADATGRGVDLSVDAMKRLRGEMAQLPGVTKSMATSMLGDLVGFRDLSTKSFGDIALMAADVAVLMRTDVPSAAKKLAEAMKDPTKGVLELNGELRLLSAQQVATAQSIAEMGDKAGAQAYVLGQIKNATQGLASEGLTPLQKATNEFGNAWSSAMDSVGDGGHLRTANELMAGLVRHTADAVQWLSQLKPPVWLEDSYKGGLNGMVYRAIVGKTKPEFSGGATGSWAPNTGGASGSWGAPAPTAAGGGGQSEWDREIESLLKATAGYKTTGQAMADLREQAGQLQRVLQDLRGKGDGDSALAKKTQAALDGVNERLANMGKSANSGAKQAQTSYQSLLSTINQKIVAMQSEAVAGKKLTETEQLRAKLQEELDTKGRQYSARQREDLESRLQVLDAAEKQAIAAKELAKANEDDARALASLTQQRDNALKATQQALRAAQDEEEAARLAAASNISNAQAVAMVASARADDAYMQAVARGEAVETLFYLEQEMQARRKLVEVMGQRGVREANEKAAKHAAQEWEKVSKTIGDTLADYIMGGGKDAAQYLKRLFATLVLQPVVQYGVQGVLGAIGMGGGSAGGGNAMGTLNNLSSLNTMYSAFSGSLTNSVGTAFSKAGQLFGSEALKSFGAGTQGAYLPAGVQGPVTGGSGAGIGASGVAAVAAVVAGMIASNKLFAQGFSANNFSSQQKTWDFGTYYQTKIASNIFGEKWANILSGAPLGNFIWNKFGPTPHSGAASEYRDGAAFGNETTAQNLVNAGDSYIQSMQSTVDGLAFGIGSALDALADSFGKKAGFYVGTGFTSDGKDPSSGYFNLTTPGGMTIDEWKISRNDPKYTSRGKKGYSKSAEEGYDEYLKDAADAALRGVFDLVPDWADDMVTSVRDSLGSMTGAQAIEAFQGVVSQIYAVKEVFKTLGESIGMFAGISGDVESILLRVSGGMEALTQNASTYYDLYYSDQEKQADAVRRFNEAIASYGVTLPTTREEYRKLIETQMSAGESGAELAAVLLKLSGDFASISDVWTAELGLMSASVSDFFSGLHDSIATVFQDVADSRKDILRGTDVMSADAIRAAIAGTALTGPSQAVAGAASNRYNAAEADVASRQQQLDALQAASNAKQQTILSKLDTAIAPRTSKPGMSDDAVWEGVISEYWNAHVEKFGKGWDTSTTTNAERAANMERMAAEYVSRKNAELNAVAAQQKIADSSGIDAAKAALDAAKEALKVAQQAATQAKADYAAQVAQYVADAGNSVGKLSDLRGEVVSFYEAQVQAVQGMLQSAGNIRGVVDQLRLGQLTTAQTAAELGNRYATDYAMALSTTGSTRAGYVDSMAGNLGSLSEALKAEAVTSAEWRIETARLFAQASNAAGLLEGDAKEDDYKDVALGLLDSIDAALSDLSNSTKSAEQVIADAINSSTQSELEGLRAIVAALKGEAIPAFAAGGFHAGGLRVVGENGPELEATGPSRIWNAQQTAAMLGGGGSSAALIAELRALRAENAQMREEAQVHALAMLDQNERIERLLERWDREGQPEQRPESAVRA